MTITLQGGQKATTRASVGRVRFGKNVYSAEVAVGMDVREQMKHLTRNLEDLISNLQQLTEPALYYGMQPIWEESQTIVPVDTGDLKASGFFNVNTSGATVSAEIGYARGGDPSYAVFVHENLEMYHKPPTTAKFLQNPFNHHLDEVVPRVVRYMVDSTGLEIVGTTAQGD